jgi:hypothetical protein
MNVIGDVMFPNGKYTKDGEEKTRWLKVGTLMQNAEGNYRLKLDAMPVNPGDGWFAVFEKDNSYKQPQAEKAAPRSTDDLDW